MSSSQTLWTTWQNVIDRKIAPLRADRPVLLSFLIFLILASIVGSLSWEYWQNEPEFLLNVLAEAHGVLLDLLLFGCLLLWFEQKAEKRRRVERYENAIADFLGWESEEAMHRIVGNIRRLNREGNAPESLKNAYLAGADLKGADLSEASLDGAVLRDADLQHADLSGVYFGTADLTGANLRKADLSGAHLGVFSGMVGSGDGQRTTLTDASLRAADLRGLRHAEASDIADARTLYKARLDEDLRRAIEETAPDLLEPQPSSAQA